MMKKPFRLGTTSFIYPDHIIPNVKKIGAFFDEIELLVFESKPKEIPSPDDVKELAGLSRDLNLTYNVHL
ncbi:MAG TPA: sugar phosphate isomerase, partial [Desulfobacter sp.]|nr:sugar phosphate isomerase [Desulfobacter sp.]